jgi:hypothetical protein
VLAIGAIKGRWAENDKFSEKIIKFLTSPGISLVVTLYGMVESARSGFD